MTDFYHSVTGDWLGCALPSEDIEQRRREVAAAYRVSVELVRAVRR